MPHNDLTVLYEDRSLVLCVKPVGVLSEDSDSAASMPALLRAHYRSLHQPDYIATVHRLDKITGGLMLFSRSKAATGKLIAAVAEHRVEKEYLAVLTGVPQQPDGVLEDLLLRDRQAQKTVVVRTPGPDTRPARLSYRVLAQAGGKSLVLIRLETGRTHQIRAQFSSRGLPLYGDRKYGAPDEGPLALWSYRISFLHPQTGRPMTFSHTPPAVCPWTLFPGSSYDSISAS